MFVKNKQILIIEDDQRIAETISKGLQEQGMTTQVAYDGKIGAKYALSGQFDLILLDLNLPQLNGYQVAEIVRKENTEVPILMLTALGETEDKVEGFEKGADDYLVKPFDFRELLVRIKSLLRRSKSAQEEENHIVELANLKVDFDAKLVFREDQPIQLTPKEFGLLEYLVKNQGKVVSKAEIAEAIWDQNASQSLNVIEVYINFLRKKIDKDFEPKVIHTKSGMGYVMRVE
ncbi:response regulator transcription factor [Jiulongibacter sediminis]|mgnify:CR=1 FL=1|uniref:response regulator transcription factor n=1 Tax=Jiulongibacter sediminis TaxID=1605367 RepID=UPI0026EF8E72|nr:response regulator transcription factor [Jiulongibacter sediminis]